MRPAQLATHVCVVASTCGPRTCSVWSVCGPPVVHSPPVVRASFRSTSLNSESSLVCFLCFSGISVLEHVDEVGSSTVGNDRIIQARRRLSIDFLDTVALFTTQARPLPVPPSSARSPLPPPSPLPSPLFCARSLDDDATKAGVRRRSLRPLNPVHNGPVPHREETMSRSYDRGGRGVTAVIPSLTSADLGIHILLHPALTVFSPTGQLFQVRRGLSLETRTGVVSERVWVIRSQTTDGRLHLPTLCCPGRVCSRGSKEGNVCCESFNSRTAPSSSRLRQFICSSF